MGRMVVILKDNQITIMSIIAPLHIFTERYIVITTINRPLNPHNITMVKEYFNQHPEKILQYYLNK
jgi:ubiquinone/menaquinone biosynthesis C-methylase UbiE